MIFKSWPDHLYIPKHQSWYNSIMKKNIIITHHQQSLQTLIDQAIFKIETDIDSEIRVYLHHLLEKTLQYPNYPEVNTEDIINYFHIKPYVSTAHLIMLADRSLLDIGLYPNQMHTSFATPHFMILSGQQLYVDLSKQSTDCHLYEKISQNFILLMDILLSFREDLFHKEPLNPEFVYFLLHKTDSKFVRSRLKR